MRKDVLRNPWTLTVLCVLYGIWLILFDQLVLTAWTLQYSYWGVLGILVVGTLLYVAFPRSERKRVLLFTGFCLLLGIGLSTVLFQPLVWRVVDYIVFVALALGIGTLALQLPVVRVLAVVIGLTAFEMWVPFSDMPLVSAFSIDADVHPIAQPSLWTQVPAVALEPAGKGFPRTIVTLAQATPSSHDSRLEAMSLSRQGLDLASAAAQHTLLLNSLAVVALSGHATGFSLTRATPEQMARVPVTQLGLTNYPLQTAYLTRGSNEYRLYETDTTNPATLLAMLLQPETLPLSTALLEEQSLQRSRASFASATGRAMQTPGSVSGWSLNGGVLTGHVYGHAVSVATKGVVVLGLAHLLPGHADKLPQVVVEGNNLIQVVAPSATGARVVATLRGTYRHPLTGAVSFADLTGNGVDDLLLDSSPAQIVSLSSTGQIVPLWVSPDPNFTFLAVYPQAKGDLLIANAPATLSTSAAVYLGGYVYHNHALLRAFRAYRDNLVQVTTIAHPGSKRPDLLAVAAGSPSVLLLTPTSFPWLTLIDVVFGIVLLTGFVRQWQGGMRRAPR
ncbi:MAG: hypothetical protein OWU32_00915 [Firmicutes bacterium]|nr:hypothetical protein [Bacillota bacterium]